MRTRSSHQALTGLPWLLLLACSTVYAGGGTQYRTYDNVRFQYAISYPEGVLYPQGEADNGDGREFLSAHADAVLTVYGRYNALDESLEGLYDDAARGGLPDDPKRVVTYKVLRKDYFVVSGHDHGQIFYHKVMLNGDVIRTMDFVYPERQKRYYDPIASRMARVVPPPAVERCQSPQRFTRSSTRSCRCCTRRAACSAGRSAPPACATGAPPPSPPSRNPIAPAAARAFRPQAAVTTAPAAAPPLTAPAPWARMRASYAPPSTSSSTATGPQLAEPLGLLLADSARAQASDVEPSRLRRPAPRPDAPGPPPPARLQPVRAPRPRPVPRTQLTLGHPRAGPFPPHPPSGRPQRRRPPPQSERCLRRPPPRRPSRARLCC